ncbi:MAG TPA: glycosyltransferase family 2 protein [Elusimicrobiota bacterium]|jgi:glycosyltransferase involved in cell wall biosynthesis|nr:glycosyltransferase family 2 protein [Elusimicrobiota bacterium]
MSTGCGSSARTAPTVSVLICTHNRLPLLKRTIASVYAQTFSGFEIVVADNDSTDGTASWLERRRFPRLRRVRLPRLEGPGSARSRGLRGLRGRFVALLDSDDLWRPAHLETLLPAFRDPKVMVAYSDFEPIDGAGRPVPGGRGLRPPDTLFEALSGERYMPLPSTAVVRRAALRRVDFDRRFRTMLDDWDFFFRLARRYGPGSFRYIDRPLVLYRRHADQVTAGLDREPFFTMEKLARWDRLSERERQRIIDLAYLGRKHGRLLRGRG